MVVVDRRRRHLRQPAPRRRRLRLPHLPPRGVAAARRSSATPSPGCPGTSSAGTRSCPTRRGFRTPRRSVLTPGWSTRQPSIEVRLSAVEFWTQWITAALWFGDGYIYAPVRDDRVGRPEAAAVAVPPPRRDDPRRHLLGGGRPLARRFDHPPAGQRPVLERPRQGVITEHGAALGSGGHGRHLRLRCLLARGPRRLSEVERSRT